MFHTYHHPFAGLATIAEIEHQPWIGRSKKSEPRGRQTGLAQEGFDLANQHGGGLSSESARPGW